jgi:hypothetical protein
MSTLSKIQELIDDKKEDISNSVYLSLCNDMKKLFEEDIEKKDNKFYEVKFLFTKFGSGNDMNNFVSGIGVYKQVIQLNPYIAEIIRKNICKSGLCMDTEVCQHMKDSIFGSLNYDRNTEHHSYKPHFTGDDVDQDEDDYFTESNTICVKHMAGIISIQEQ